MTSPENNGASSPNEGNSQKHPEDSIPADGSLASSDSSQVVDPPSPIAYQAVEADSGSDGFPTGDHELEASTAPVKLPQPHIGFSILWVLGLFVLQMGVGLVAAAIGIFSAIAAGRPPTSIQPEDLVSIWLLPLASGLTMVYAFGVSFVMVRKNRKTNMAWRSCSPLQWLLVLLSVIPLAVFASEIGNIARQMFQTVGLDFDGPDFVHLFKDMSFLFGFIAIAVFPGIGEELLFRGYLSRGLVAWHGPIVGGLLASFLFGLIHVEPIQATAAFILGIALQFVFMTTRSLLAPIVIHILNNTLAFVMFVYASDFPVDGLAEATPEIEHVPWPVIMASVAAIAVLGKCMYDVRTRFRLSDGTLWDPGYRSTEAPPLEVNATAESDSLSIGMIAALVASAVAVISTMWAHS